MAKTHECSSALSLRRTGMTCMSAFTKASKFGLQVDKIKQLHFFWNRFKPEKAYGIQGFLLIKIEILKSRTPTSSSDKAPLSYNALSV